MENRPKPKKKIVSHHFSGVNMLVLGSVKHVLFNWKSMGRKHAPKVLALEC